MHTGAFHKGFFAPANPACLSLEVKEFRQLGASEIAKELKIGRARVYRALAAGRPSRRFPDRLGAPPAVVGGSPPELPDDAPELIEDDASTKGEAQ